MRTKWAVPGLIVPVILILDFITKRWALDALANNHRIELMGGLVPLNLAYNRGAAFGLTIGDDPRWIFVPITVVALIILTSLFRQARADDWLRLGAISLVVAGAVGNLYDRVRWDRGVVDFVGPINLGFMDWPIFNVADMAITTGAILLAISFALEGREATDEPGTITGTPASQAAEGGPEPAGGGAS